jgi:hypothetical protein
MYSPSALLKMSIKLCQQDSLYYSTTDTSTVNTNPRSRCSPFVSFAFTDLAPDVHLINEDIVSDCSKASDDYKIPVDPTDTDDAHMATAADLTTPPQQLPCIPTKSAPSAPCVRVPPLPRSWVQTQPTNLARQLESELWAACLGHCGKDQLIALATWADSLPNSFEFHPFQHIDWKVQAWIRKSTARQQALEVDEAGAQFYMDFGFIRASSDNYQRPNTRSDRIVDSYEGYNSYLLIVDNKLSMTWVFLMKSKSPPLEIIRLFL